MTRLIATALATLLCFTSGAGAQQAVQFVTLEDVIVAFARNSLADFSDQTVDPQFPSIAAKRADGFTVQATFYACVPEACGGVSLTAPIPARELRFARLIEGSIERSARGFDAWTQDMPPVVVIETYIAYDGGVSDNLLPSTVMSLMSVVDQTKDFMISDDPRVVEVWPDAATAD